MESKQPHSPRRLNSIISGIGARSYLEIGVFDGTTFVNVDCNLKAAVDPKFRFNYLNYSNASTEFYEMTSDQFFTQELGRRDYDVIFIDGLHVFSQVLRDLCASQAYANPKTVWLIDDVYPNDVYSTWPDQIEAMRFRKEGKIEGKSWHGDVFKIVYFINEFLPSFNYVTIRTKGNPQLLLWQEPRADFTPSGIPLAKIEAMTYFDMRRDERPFRFTEEEDALSRVIESINGKRT